MDPAVAAERVTSVLRDAGARFAYLFGSRADEAARRDSDIDVAAYFGNQDVDPTGLPGVPEQVDLIALDAAPLEIAGRVAMSGVLLFDDDPAARVAWEATTRKIFLDERSRVERSRSDFARAARARGRS